VAGGELQNVAALHDALQLSGIRMTGIHFTALKPDS